MRRFLAAVAAFVLLSACAAPSPVDENVAAAPPTRSTSGALAIFPILDAEAGPSENLVYSPASVDQAFGLLRLGASGNTAAQLDAILPAPRNADYLRNDKRDVEVRLANALFLSDTFRFRETFERAASERYDATSERIDFTRKEAAAKRINAWASAATEQLITEVVTPQGIDDDQAAILANALYFDGKWANKLVSQRTRPFLFGNGGEKPFKFVGDVQSRKLVERDGWQALRLPYRNERYVMDIVMPEERAVMPQAPTIARIQAIAEALNAAEARLVDVLIPQFEVDYSTGLIEALKAIGLTAPFSETQADFGAMVEPGERGVVVDKVQHITKLQVFDEGTRAAAVTTLSIIPTSARIYETPPVPFVADRPFVIVIRDLEAGEILFIGRIADPQPFEPEVQEP